MNVKLQIFVALGVVSGCTLGMDPEDNTRAATLGGRYGAPNLYGINVAADGAPGGAAVRDLGATWARIELVDHSTGAALSDEARSRLDGAIADYHAHGIRLLLIVDYSSYGGYPGFYECGVGGDWDGWRAGFLARTQWVAQTYGDAIDAWEVWNEEDHPVLPCGGTGYNPGVPASVFGPFLRDTHGAIRTGSKTPIVMGGLDSGQVSYLTEARDAAGGLWADGVAIHPYGVVPSADWCPDPGEDLNCEWGSFASKIDEYYAAAGVPIWLTELGLRSTDTQHQANYVEAAYVALAARADKVATGFYFCYTDAMVPPFGLTYDDGSPKPGAFVRYQQIAGAAAEEPGPGSTMASRLHGTVETGDGVVADVFVSAWGHNAGDFHQTYTDAGGIYAFESLDPGSLYNIVVNATYADGWFAAVDGSHALEVRDNVVLEAGADGWHGENFTLPY